MRSTRYFVRERATTSRGSRDSVDARQFARSNIPLSASLLGASLEAAEFERVGLERALLGTGNSEETGMYQQANVNEELLSQGDAINELFAQHYGVSLRTAYRILRSKEDAEDAVQTAYCAAFRNFNNFRGESTFKTWITRIVVNSCLIQLRERRAKRQVSLDDIQPALESHALTPEKLCYQRELQAAHTKAASRLPQILRDIYGPCLIADIAFPTVAHHLGVVRDLIARRELFNEPGLGAKAGQKI